MVPFAGGEVAQRQGLPLRRQAGLQLRQLFPGEGGLLAGVFQARPFPLGLAAPFLQCLAPAVNCGVAVGVVAFHFAEV